LSEKLETSTVSSFSKLLVFEAACTAPALLSIAELTIAECWSEVLFVAELPVE
jgi:hypothetical protein